MTSQQWNALARRQARLNRLPRPYRHVVNHIEQAKILLAKGEDDRVYQTFKNVCDRAERLSRLVGAFPPVLGARHARLIKMLRFWRRIAAEIALVLWDDVEDVTKQRPTRKRRRVAKRQSA